jgi:hypothetical protein
MITTEISKQEAKYSRTARISFQDGKLVFDNSDGEYGPSEVSIEELVKKLTEHLVKIQESSK